MIYKGLEEFYGNANYHFQWNTTKTDRCFTVLKATYVSGPKVLPLLQYSINYLKDCMVGFVFCDESEADAFHKKVKKNSKKSKREVISTQSILFFLIFYSRQETKITNES